MKNILLIALSLLFSLSVLGQNSINYRDYQTPIKNQGDRGTCTAFSVSAMLETLPGVPADISEQYLYASLKHSQEGVPYDEGDRLGNYVKSLQDYGIIHESQLAYNQQSSNWGVLDTEFARLISGTQIGAVSLLLAKYWSKYSLTKNEQFNYFEFNSPSDPAIIKRLLQNGNKAIAVSYNWLHLPTWSEAGFTAENPLQLDASIGVVLNGNQYSFSQAKRLYNGDLIADLLSEKVQFFLRDATFVDASGIERSNYGGHAVTIVGYNDKGFIFKNSWGRDWNDGGYGYISYDAHRMMCREALSINEVTFQKPKHRNNVSASTRFMLKSTYSNNKSMQLSMYTHDILSDPLISKVEYDVYFEDKLIEQVYKVSPIIGPYDNSFSVDLFKFNKLMPPKVLFFDKPMRVVVKIHLVGEKQPRLLTYSKVYNRTREYRDSTDLYQKMLDSLRED